VVIESFKFFFKVMTSCSDTLSDNPDKIGILPTFVRSCYLDLFPVLKFLFHSTYNNVLSGVTRSKNKDLKVVSLVILLFETLNGLKGSLNESSLDDINFTVQMREDVPHSQLQEHLKFYTNVVHNINTGNISESIFQEDSEVPSEDNEQDLPPSEQNFNKNEEIVKGFDEDIASQDNQSQKHIADSKQFMFNTDASKMADYGQVEDAIEYIEKIIYKSIGRNKICKQVIIR
jgi:hypothetical protein